jgi:hypothetical protein
MLEVFLYIFLFFLGFYLFFSIFGKRILLFLLRRYVAGVEKKMRAQAEQFQKKYDPDFEKELHISNNVKIQVPYNSPKKTAGGNIQDVDFEEIK